MKNYTAYINQRFKSIHHYLNRYRKTATPEDLHKYRVEFKKLKVIYLVNLYCHPELNAENAYRKVKKLFRKSGKLRDAYIIQELLKKHNIVLTEPETEEERLQRNWELKKFFKRICSSQSAFLDLQKQLIKDSRHISKVSVQGYVASIQADILNNIRTDETEAILHNLRKQLKELSYMAAVLPGLMNRQTLNRCHHLQVYIGEWHDKMVLIDFLEHRQPNLRRPINSLIEKSRKDLKRIRTKLSEVAF